MKKPNRTLGVEQEKIAKKVLITPDIESCVHVAETYLKNYVKFNGNKNFTGYTGTYLDKTVTVISAGFGSAMMRFLAQDLFCNYGAETVIYAGLCDSLKEEIEPRQYVLARDAEDYVLFNVPCADEELNEALQADFEKRGELVNFAYENPVLNVGSIVSLDEGITEEEAAEYAKAEVIARDTASAALFTLAEEHGKKAASLLLVDKNLITGEEMSDKEYQRTSMRQILIALANL